MAFGNGVTKAAPLDTNGTILSRATRKSPIKLAG